MKSLLALLLLFAPLSITISAQEPPEPTMERAQALIQAGDFPAATEMLTVLVERRPTDGMAWFLLGYSVHAGGDPERALEYHVKASEFAQVGAVASYNAACSHALAGRTDDAFAWLDKAMDKGFNDLAQLRQDSDLTSLHDDPRWATVSAGKRIGSKPFSEDVVILHDLLGEAEGDQFGWVARALGDVDGDEVQDFASTAPFHAGSGAVYVYSGKTGKLVRKHTGDGQGAQFGWAVGPAGDVDGDRRADYLIGAPGDSEGRGKVYVFSGASGEELLAVAGMAEGDRFGSDARGVGDADGDGTLDFLVGAPNHDVPSEGGALEDAGQVTLHAANDGRILHVFVGETAGANLGGGVAGGDGLLVFSGVNGGAGSKGVVVGYGTPNFERRFVIEGRDSAQNLGWFLSLVPDQDGDGVQDVYATDWHDGKAGAGAGAAHVFSGKDGDLVRSFDGRAAGDGFGIGVGHAGDLDRDGVADLVIGAWRNSEAGTQAGKVYVFSGKDGTELAALTGAIAGDVLGFDATGVGDVNADGVPDLLLTSAYSATAGAKTGRAYVISGASLVAPVVREAAAEEG